MPNNNDVRLIRMIQRMIEVTTTPMVLSKTEKEKSKSAAFRLQNIELILSPGLHSSFLPTPVRKVRWADICVPLLIEIKSIFSVF